MAVKTRKQGNSITITIPSEFNIPSGVHYDSFELDLDNIFDEYDDIFKALVEK